MLNGDRLPEGNQLESAGLFFAATAEEHSAILKLPATCLLWQIERYLSGNFTFYGRQRLHGWCSVCSTPRTFHAKLSHLKFNGAIDPAGYRNTLTCSGCRLSSRQRLLIDVARRSVRLARKIYVCEHISPLPTVVSKVFPGAHVTSSEFLDAKIAAGAVLGNGIRHEDAEKLSFGDASMDLYLSGDVLEHIPDVDAAISEAGRILGPGGSFVFTIPFRYTEANGRIRARMHDGRVELLEAAEYHRDPLRKGGALVFHDFGWDLLDKARSVGFDEATAVIGLSLTHAYFGHPNHCFVFRKSM